ncbi:transposase, partial [Microcoleus sp. Z1_C4]
RTHACRCGCVLDRDHNAGRNILSRGLSTAGHVGTWILDPNACGELTATDVEVILHRQVDSANQESPRL